MAITTKTKQELFSLLLKELEQKITVIKTSISDASESMKNDTKSSAGDKFETGREMIQIELNNQHKQLNQLLQLKKDLLLIDPSNTSISAGFGSLVETNIGHYFISVALGKIKINETVYYTLSLASPIGKHIKGKKAGDKCSFQGRTIEIIDVI